MTGIIWGSSRELWRRGRLEPAHDRPGGRPGGLSHGSTMLVVRAWRGMLLASLALGLTALLAASAHQVTITPRPKPAPKEEGQRAPNIRVESRLVLIPVTVNDPLNRPVSGLEKENFRVYDDKVEQTITQLAMDDEPI